MKKLKLLFPLLGTSALAVAPMLTAQTNSTNKTSNLGLAPSQHVVYGDNNSKMYLNGMSDEYYYDLSGGFIHKYYTEANLNFTLTSYGTTQLAKAEIATKHTTATMIMYFLSYGLGDNHETQLKHFGEGYVNSYLNEITGDSDNHLMGPNFIDRDAYSDFMDHMDQPASVVDQITDMYKKGVALPQISVRFHYDFHTFAKDDFDVSFTIGNYPPSNLVPGTKNTLNPSQFIGHFPGMGPYGKAGNQDHAKLISSESTSESLKLDLSTTSINYINSHFLNKPVPSSKIALAVMDYLHDAYPSSDWKATLAGILRAGGVPAVNYVFGKLIDFIGTYQKDGKTLLKNTPAYYYIKDGDSFTAAKNQPFS